MRVLMLPAVALIVGISTLIAAAQSPCDTALRIILANAARQGLLAARAEYDTDTATGAELVAMSRRVLEAQSDRLFGGPYNAAAAKEHLLVAERARRGTDVSRDSKAAIADFDFQIARAIVATSDPKIRPIWKANIQALCRLQGHWMEEPTSQASNSQSRHADAKDESSQKGEYLHFHGGIVDTRSADGMRASAFVTLSAGLSPMQFDFYGFNEDYVFAAAGIFRVSGDTLQIAVGQGPNNRPTSFIATKNADGLPLSVVRTFRRQPGPPPVRRNADADDAELFPWLKSNDQ